MADNVQADLATTSGPIFVTANLSWSGDTANLPGIFAGILTGSEGSWSFTVSPGGAGAVTAGTPRMTLASDDPAVAAITAINTKTPALGQALAAASIPVVLTAAQLSTLTPLTGGATAANQSTEITALAAIISALSSVAVTGTFWQATQPVSGTFWQATQPISVVSLPLPSGAATEATLTALSGHVTKCNTDLTLVEGTHAHGSALSGGPITIGGISNATGQTPLGADGLVVKAWFDRYGSQVVSLAIAGGTLLTGDATNGLDVDVTRVKPDGTNAMPSLDTVGRAGFVKVTDGTNTMPTMDSTSRPGIVAACGETSTVFNGATALVPKFAAISCAASGDNTLVAAVTSKKIRVLALTLIGSGTAVSVYFREDTAGTAIFGDNTNKIPLDKTGAAGPSGFVLGHNPQGWMQSAVGKPLVLNLSTAQGVAGGLLYLEV